MGPSVCGTPILSPASPETSPRIARQAVPAAVVQGLLVLVGLAQVAVALTGWVGVRDFGVWPVAAPLPLVFNNRYAEETYARRFEIQVTTATGARLGFDGRQVVEALEGPFRRKKLWIGPLWLLRLNGPEYSYRVIQRGFCDGGPVASALGIDAPIRVVEVHSWSALVPGEPEVRVPVPCVR